jgi:AP-2 complex subunit mu-1
MDAVVDLIVATREKPWVRPPISVDFQIPMYSASGVQVRFLKVFFYFLFFGFSLIILLNLYFKFLFKPNYGKVYEKSAYQTARWVKYLTKAGPGEYQIRV